MKKLNASALQMQKLAGIITESEYNTEISKMKSTPKMKSSGYDLNTVGDLIDQMQDSEEGLDQGLTPSQLIDYDSIAKKCAAAGFNIDVNKLKKLAKQNDSGFMYSGKEMLELSKSDAKMKSAPKMEASPVDALIDTFLAKFNVTLTPEERAKFANAIEMDYDGGDITNATVNDAVEIYDASGIRSIEDDEVEESEMGGDRTNLTMNLKKEADKRNKMYFHILEDGGYGNIGHQGVYDTEEAAQKRADELSDMFPNSSFYVEASNSKREPVTVTV